MKELLSGLIGPVTGIISKAQVAPCFTTLTVSTAFALTANIPSYRHRSRNCRPRAVPYGIGHKPPVSMNDPLISKDSEEV